MQQLLLLSFANYINSIYYIIFYILLGGYLSSFSLILLSKLNTSKVFFKNFNIFFFVKYILLLTFSISTILLVYLFFYYTYYYSYLVKLNILNSFYYENDILNPKIILFENFLFSIDINGIILCILAFIVGFLSFLALDTRLYFSQFRFILMCHLLCLFIFLFISVNNILLLFFFYECLLVPSFLFVYFVSPYRRSVQASLYFLIWTQIGSVLVLLGVAYLFYLTGEFSFKYIQLFNFTKIESYILFTLFFLGFGVKIPIWPFHHWLIKTHVEAPAGFSMFLSGFLVKSALFGFFKLTNLITYEINTNIFLTIILIGVIDSSLKMWSQTDVKKLVAFGTIQEMNLIFLLFNWGSVNALYGGLIFCITHSFLSGLLFYTVDCIQRRYHSRSVPEISGILNLHPTLGVIIFFNCILYSGLPGTLKFISEMYIYTGLMENSFLISFVLFFICNYLGIIGFSKCWFNILFGLTTFNKKSYISIDLSFKEFIIILNCYIVLILFTLLSIYVFII